MADDIEQVIRDKNYEGMAVIDLEEWRPVYKRLWEDMNIYRNKSEELVRKEHPTWSDNRSRIFSEAKSQFEAAAKDFMLETLQLGRKLRPKALWGYYGFPRCYNDNTNTSKCQNFIEKDNDKLMWMFNASTVILPSIYLNEEGRLTDNFDYVKGNIEEAIRIENQTKGRPLPIYAYVRLVYAFSDIFLNKTDMYATVTQSAELGSSGVIIWGSSDDKTEKFCTNLQTYIYSFFGPFVQRLSSIAEDCSEKYCSSNGRCQFKMSHLKQFKMSDFLDSCREWQFVKCNCDKGWEGRDCSLPTEPDIDIEISNK